MKYLLSFLVAMLSLATVSCEHDNVTPVDPIRPGFDLLEAEVDVTSATLAAYLDYQGEAPIESVGFSYQEAAGAEGGYRDVPCSEWDGKFARAELTGLKAQTSYRYYCYALIDGQRLASPLSSTFTTLREGEVPEHPKPRFGTPYAGDVSSEGALLNCNYTYLGDAAPTAAGFRYKAKDATEYLNAEASDISSPLSCALSGLEQLTAYVFQAYITVDGQTYHSAEAAFTTLREGEQPVQKPRMELPTVVNLTSVSADLKCSYAYDGDAAISEGGFYYKAESEPSYRKVIAPEVSSPLLYALTGLEPQTEYTFYAYTLLGGELVRSDETSFTTPAAAGADPIFSALSAREVTASSATLTGTLAYEGEEPLTEAGFEYKAASAGSYTRAAVSASAGSKSVVVSNLTASTAYTFRLYAVVGGKRFESGTATFTTPNNPTPPPATTARYGGWAELPGETVKSGDYYYAYHITDVNTPAGHKARNYGVCYSNQRKCALWVAAPMHSFYSQKNTSRSDAYRADPDIPVSQPGKWSGYTRGHMLGSAERLVSSTANRQVFYYSNIAPQLGQPGFNTGDGAWNNLESYVDSQWEGYRDTVYQVLGCLWEGSVKTVSGTDIPTHYYKILLRTKKRNTDKWVVNCTRDELQCVAFVVKHEHNKGLKPSRSMMTTVADIERRTGIEFFPNVPNAPKDTFDPSEWGL